MKEEYPALDKMKVIWLTMHPGDTQAELKKRGLLQKELALRLAVSGTSDSMVIRKVGVSARIEKAVCEEIGKENRYRKRDKKTIRQLRATLRIEKAVCEAIGKENREVFEDKYKKALTELRGRITRLNAYRKRDKKTIRQLRATRKDPGRERWPKSLIDQIVYPKGYSPSTVTRLYHKNRIARYKEKIKQLRAELKDAKREQGANLKITELKNHPARIMDRLRRRGWSPSKIARKLNVSRQAVHATIYGDASQRIRAEIETILGVKVWG